MKRKKYRLKKWVKDALLVIFIVFVMTNSIFVIISALRREARECDEYYGHTCSIYEIDQYGKGIRRN